MPAFQPLEKFDRISRREDYRARLSDRILDFDDQAPKKSERLLILDGQSAKSGDRNSLNELGPFVPPAGKAAVQPRRRKMVPTHRPGKGDRVNALIICVDPLFAIRSENNSLLEIGN